jgi:acyl-coenzyme A thioesterase PaaI-like protein
MSLRLESGELLRKAWDQLSLLPGGKLAFSKLIATLAPYTATIRACVLDLAPGYARVEMRDRRGVRNHLRSVHAVALVNLAELCSGVAMNYALPPGGRGILVGFEIDYLKKARGRLSAESQFVPPQGSDRGEHRVPVAISDQAGDVVVEAAARWLVGPRASG